jgi:hypothetical protein
MSSGTRKQTHQDTDARLNVVYTGATLRLVPQNPSNRGKHN